ncbi:MAG: DMT family transporter [Anaerovoracaceae bacterium]
MKRNYTFALLTVIIWATMAAAVKLMLSSVPDLEALCISAVFAFLFLLLVNVFTGKIKELGRYKSKDYLTMAALGFVGLFLYSALYYYGLSKLSSQTACILNYLWPAALVLFSCIILREKITALKIAALAMSFAGVMIMSSGASESGAHSASGVIACILAALCYGLYCVLNRKKDYDQNISMMVVWLTVAICSAVSGPWLETWAPISGTQWIGLLWLGVVVDAIAYLLWALALTGTENIAGIANLAYLTPFLSLIFSALILHEHVTARDLAALLFIVGGIVMQKIFDKEA